MKGGEGANCVDTDAEGALDIDCICRDDAERGFSERGVVGSESEDDMLGDGDGDDVGLDFLVNADCENRDDENDVGVARSDCWEWGCGGVGDCVIVEAEACVYVGVCSSVGLLVKVGERVGAIGLDPSFEILGLYPFIEKG